MLNNCDSNAIAYPSLAGEIFHVTREDFPSEDAFLALKVWSDADFHKEDNGDVVEDKRRISADGISGSALSVPPIDAVMEHRQLPVENSKITMDIYAKAKSSEI